MLFISAGSSQAILRESQLQRSSTHVLYDNARHITKIRIITTNYFQTICLVTLFNPHHPLLVTSAKISYILKNSSVHFQNYIDQGYIKSKVC